MSHPRRSLTDMRHDIDDRDEGGPDRIEEGSHDGSEIFADPVAYLEAHGIVAELIEVGNQTLAPAA